MNYERFALNRIIAPTLDFEEFIAFTSDTGIRKVELRNDIPGKGIIDSLPPARAREILGKHGVEVLTINALQRFDVESLLESNIDELKEMIHIARQIGCRAIVMCPDNEGNNRYNNDAGRFITSLKKYAPFLEEAEMQGFIEPLGFNTSSLRSILEAQEILKGTVADTYRIVLDTFHFFLGKDSVIEMQKQYEINKIGIVHVSGVRKSHDSKSNGSSGSESRITYSDEDRILPRSDDLLRTREQLDLLFTLGYKGDISFEPFSSSIHRMPKEELKEEIRQSIEYISEKSP